MTLPTMEDFSGVRFQITVRGKAALANWDAPLLDDAQIRSLFRIHAPRLRALARRFGVQPCDCDEVATTLLDDVVLNLLERRVMPSDMTLYLNAALRNYVRRMHRDGRRTECLEYLDRDIPIAEPWDAPPSDALTKLAAACMTARMDSLDTVLLAAHGSLPVRVIAEELGITPPAARVRLFRAKRRMLDAAKEYLCSVGDEERDEIERFLRRAL